MKKIIKMLCISSLFLATLTACQNLETSVPETYPEVLIPEEGKDESGFYQITDEQLLELEAGYDFLYENSVEIEPLKTLNSDECDALALNSEDAFCWDGHVMLLVENPETENTNDYLLFLDGEELFPITFALEEAELFLKVRILDGDPLISFRSPDGLEQKDVYYRGEFFSEVYDVISLDYVFAYENKLGFVAQTDLGKYRIIYDGEVVSESFDKIITSSCCMSPRPFLKLYENGSFVFVGERDGKSYLVEVLL